MPVVGCPGGERPLHCVPLQTGLDVYVLGDVEVVIVVEEREMLDRVIDGKSGDGEQESEQERSIRRRQSASRWPIATWERRRKRQPSRGRDKRAAGRRWPSSSALRAHAAIAKPSGN